MSLKKILIFTISILILAICGWFFIAIWNISPDYSPYFEKSKLVNSNSTDSVFIKKKVWGVTSNHQIITISKNSNTPFNPDSTSDFIFKGLSPFFYKFQNDSLTVFVRHASEEPPKFKSDITIQQKALTNPEMMNLFDTYEEKNLTLFSR